jgi:hypothetical protein
MYLFLFKKRAQIRPTNPNSALWYSICGIMWTEDRRHKREDDDQPTISLDPDLELDPPFQNPQLPLYIFHYIVRFFLAHMGFFVHLFWQHVGTRFSNQLSSTPEK